MPEGEVQWPLPSCICRLGPFKGLPTASAIADPPGVHGFGSAYLAFTAWAQPAPRLFALGLL